MEKATVSIIIPVYKIEAYLPRCLDSVIRQTYRNLEIILVDDGSPDSSGEICDRYAKADSRIRVVHRENGGASAARNSGLDRASGEYIFFLDGDDYIADNTIEALMKNMLETDADCVCGAWQNLRSRPDGTFTEEKRRKASPPSPELNTREAVQYALLHGSSACNRLYRAALFSGLRFPTGRTNEDEITVLHVYERCAKVTFLDEITYFYCKRPGSVTTSTDTAKPYLDFIRNAQENLNYIREKYPELTPCAESRVITAMTYGYYRLWKLRRNPDDKRHLLDLRKKIRSGEYQAMARNNPYVSGRYRLLMKAFLLF